MLKRRCGELAGQHPGFLATSFTPHDFRRLLATNLVNSGLPIHIGAALLGHVNLQTTRGQRPCSTKTSSATTRDFSTGAARPGHRMSTGRSPNPSGSGSRSTSTSARSNWEAAPVPTGPPPGPPKPGRPRGLARRSRRPRPHPHLPPPKTRTDTATHPHRAHRPRHAGHSSSEGEAMMTPSAGPAFSANAPARRSPLRQACALQQNLTAAQPARERSS